MPSAFDFPDAATLAALLSRDPASADLMRDTRAGDILAMREKGIAHRHFRLRRTGMVLRVPRLLRWSADPARTLAYEAECFRRAAPSGATPALRAVLPVQEGLPGGALLVEEISGLPPRLPDELPSLAEALALLHALPLPPPEARSPLLDHAAVGPVAATLAVIESQMAAFAEAALPHETRGALEEELTWARRFAGESRGAEQPIALVGTDTHPGNFLVRADGSAVFVDLEKALYGSPAIDLAHASLFTSTTWDRDVQIALSPAEIRAFYRCYLERVGPKRAARLQPWLAPSRRLTWLRTMMWATRWRGKTRDVSGPPGDTIDAALLAHVRSRVDAFFDPNRVAAIRSEWLGDSPFFV